ncbi:MAG: hypothetical protein IJ019_01455 [Alphaproteobacteria bacterium]|nr:hypothetical protein [Alphaproteobacteria bacterium]
MRKVCEFGRSMVEMLGVLAIIGVLSVGGIAGYSKAMEKYKLNKQTEQITTILSGLIEHKSFFSSTIAGENLFPYYKTLNIIPTEMIKGTNEFYIYDVFNIPISISRQVDTFVQFVFSFSDKDSKNYESCINIFNVVKGFGDEIYALGINANSIDNENPQQWYYGNFHAHCVNSGQCIRTLNLANIQEMCDKCINSNHCSIAYLFSCSA